MSEPLWRYWKGRVSPSLPKQHAQEEYARLAGLVPVADGTVLIEDGELRKMRNEIAFYLKDMGLDIANFAAADGVIRLLRAAIGERP